MNSCTPGTLSKDGRSRWNLKTCTAFHQWIRADHWHPCSSRSSLVPGKLRPSEWSNPGLSVRAKGKSGPSTPSNSSNKNRTGALVFTTPRLSDDDFFSSQTRTQKTRLSFQSLVCVWRVLDHLHVHSCELLHCFPSSVTPTAQVSSLVHSAAWFLTVSKNTNWMPPTIFAVLLQLVAGFSGDHWPVRLERYRHCFCNGLLQHHGKHTGTQLPVLHLESRTSCSVHMQFYCVQEGMHCDTT